jgi:hypothetical protein
MRDITELFLINGKPMLAPDEKVQVSYEDLDDSNSGRDESGFMHRQVLRYKLPVWSFTYSHLTEEERQYMENLFRDADTFTFSHPTQADASRTEDTLCYRSGYDISWRNAKTGLWSGYGFSVIEC